MNTRPFTLIAHRGASAEAPENTFAAFDLAIKQGVADLELDVHLAQDNTPVVIHDSTVNRTTNGFGLVNTKAVQELKRLDAGSWFDPAFHGQQIPTLREVLERYGQVARFHIELKDDGSPRTAVKAMELVKAMGLTGNAAFISFYPQQLSAVLSQAPGQPTGYLVTDFTGDTVEEAFQLGVMAIAPPAPLISLDLVQLANDKGLRVRAWGVQSDQDLHRVVELGCDGCTVDWPARGIAYLERGKITCNRA